MKDLLKGKTKIAAIGALSLCIVASTVMSAIALGNIGAMRNEVNQLTDNVEDVNRENDVTILKEYEIKSTEKISDAYKKGSTAGLNDREKEILDMAKDVLDEIITDDMTDYDKEKACYDWLVNNIGENKGMLSVIPSGEDEADDPYGTLKYRNAVCVGYATTFRLFMQMMDIECMVVHNTELYHTWNLVKLEDKWYHTDIYSDSTAKNYGNFNMTDTLCEINHDWNRDFFPAAEGTKYCYANMNRETAKDIYDIPAAVKKAMDEGKLAFIIGFEKQPEQGDKGVLVAMMNALTDRIMMDYVDAAVEYNTIADDNGDILLYINITIAEIETEEIPPEKLDKIDDKIRDAFGDEVIMGE